MLALLADGDFVVRPNVLLVVVPLLTLSLVVLLVILLVRWNPRGSRETKRD